MVADMGAKKMFLADMELDMVADKEVDKVANMVAGHGCWLLVNWVQTFSTRIFNYFSCKRGRKTTFY